MDIINSSVSLIHLFLLQELLNEQSKSQQCLMDDRHLPGEIDTMVKPFLVNNVISPNYSYANLDKSDHK